MKRVCICILAHNEEAQIKSTIHSLRKNSNVMFPIKVYANGCTDSTIDIVKKVAEVIEYVAVVEISIPSKVNAWNCAFNENEEDILIFSDGDVEADVDAISAMIRELQSNPECVIAACKYRPRSGLGVQKSIVGFLQQPLVFDYLCGGLYAVNREKLSSVLKSHSLTGIPEGVTGEDDFLDMVLAVEQLRVVKSYFYYTPPAIVEFCKVLARFRWQSEQLEKYYAGLFHKSKRKRNNFYSRLKIKILNGNIQWWPGFLSTILRVIFMFLFRNKIRKFYHNFGTVKQHGASVLADQSRTVSARK